MVFRVALHSELAADTAIVLVPVAVNGRLVWTCECGLVIQEVTCLHPEDKYVYMDNEGSATHKITRFQNILLAVRTDLPVLVTVRCPRNDLSGGVLLSVDFCQSSGPRANLAD